jgi:hypothetical protein
MVPRKLGKTDALSGCLRGSFAKLRFMFRDKIAAHATSVKKLLFILGDFGGNCRR